MRLQIKLSLKKTELPFDYHYSINDIYLKRTDEYSDNLNEANN